MNIFHDNIIESNPDVCAKFSELIWQHRDLDCNEGVIHKVPNESSKGLLGHIEDAEEIP